MAESFKDKVEDAGHKIAEKATEVGHKVGEKVEEAVAAIRAAGGKDVWLFGGGGLFRSLLRARLVDTIEVAIMPVLLGGGIPLLPPPWVQAKLRLANHRIYKTGIVSLEYEIG